MIAHKECQICGKLFVGPSSTRDFLTHEKKHNKKPNEFKCEFCNKVYKYKSQLKTHQKVCPVKKKMEQWNMSNTD